MRHLLGFAVGALALLAATAPEASAVPDGGYIAIGIGGAIASGDRGVELDSPTAQAAQLGCPTCYDETVRTDFGSGLALHTRTTQDSPAEITGHPSRLVIGQIRPPGVAGHAGKVQLHAGVLERIFNRPMAVANGAVVMDIANVGAVWCRQGFLLSGG